MKYIFIIKNAKTKNYRAISQLLVLFNLLGFIFLFISYESVISKNYWLFFSILATAVFIFFSIIGWFTKNSIPDFWHRFIFLFCAAAWLNEKYWWLSIILLFFVLLDILAHRKLVVTVTEKKITLASFPKKEVAWSDLNNLVLKDDLLTIDFKNNKLFQQLIYNPGDGIDEAKFNQLCRQYINKD